MRVVICLSFVMLLILAMQAGRCDDAKIFDLLNTDSLPLVYLVSDMEGWKCFTLDEPGKAAGAAPAAGIALSGMLFFTKGEMLPVGNERFLVAYRLPKQVDDITGTQAVRALQQDDLMRPDTELVVSLLNLRTLNMFDIQPAEAGWRQLVGDETGGELARYRAQLLTSMSNLRQLGLALQIWAQDHNNTLPAMKTLDELKEALKPYLGNAPGTDRLWIDPVTNQPYFTNPALSGILLTKLRGDWASIMALYSGAYPDGTRTVTFLDGHTNIVTPEQWDEVEEMSGMPRQ